MSLADVLRLVLFCISTVLIYCASVIVGRLYETTVSTEHALCYSNLQLYITLQSINLRRRIVGIS